MNPRSKRSTQAKPGKSSPEKALYQAIGLLGDAHELQAFFRDLCTPAELRALAGRWQTVGMLERGLPYREIHRLTGVSVTTVGRVARYLREGNGGYALAASRKRDNRDG